MKRTGISLVMRRLSSYMAGAIERPLPPRVAEKARQHLLDTVAAMISGSRLLPGQTVIHYVKALGGARQACVIGTRLITSMANAALANGMFAHADETDDTHAPSLSHPGCGVVPAALAMAEHQHSSGEAMLRAIVLGYDVNCRSVQALGPVEFFQSGHSSHSFGAVFGAAAAAGALAGLNADQMRYLLSYAAQQASGLSCFLRDRQHIEKGFDLGGMPARNGITAATMVAHGFSAVDDVFSGERNFLLAYSAAPRPAELVRGLGKHFDIMDADIKRWPVGSPIQAPLNSLATLMQEHRIRAPDIDTLRAYVGVNEANYIDDRPQLTNNLQHMLAIMLLDGELTFHSCHDETRTRDPQLIRMKRRIELVGSEDITNARPRRQGIIEIATRDGRRVAHRTRAVMGTAFNPMTRTQLEEKCSDLMVPVLGAPRSRRLMDALWNIETVEDVRALRPLLMV